MIPVPQWGRRHEEVGLDVARFGRSAALATGFFRRSAGGDRSGIGDMRAPICRPTAAASPIALQPAPGTGRPRSRGIPAERAAARHVGRARIVVTMPVPRAPAGRSDGFVQLHRERTATISVALQSRMRAGSPATARQMSQKVKPYKAHATSKTTIRQCYQILSEGARGRRVDLPAGRPRCRIDLSFRNS